MLLSSISFAIVNIIVKILAGDTGILPSIQAYPVTELIFFRSVISLAICVAIIRTRGIPFFGNNKKWLLIRGIFGATSLTLFFFTLKNLPLAIATVVQYLSPIFTIIFAIYLQKEKVKPVQWVFFAVSMFGIYIIGKDRGGSVDYDPFWLIIGVVSSLLTGIAYNAIMKCRKTDAPVTVVMYFPLIAAPVMLVVTLVDGFLIPVGVEWLMLLLIGVMTQIAQVCMTRAFNSASAANVTPIKYIGAIYAVSIGYFIFDETLSLWSSMGIALVLLGVLLNTFLKSKKTALSKV